MVMNANFVFQVFQRLDASSVTQGLDVRFDFLIRKVIPDHTDSLMAHTMIYVPSYFDFVRIRNYLRKQDLGFVQICEYSKVCRRKLFMRVCIMFCFDSCYIYCCFLLGRESGTSQRHVLSQSGAIFTVQ